MPASDRLYKQSGRLPLPWGRHFLGIAAKDPVLWLSGALAVLSSAAVRPSAGEYAGYIDFKTLACLACLMTASGGFAISGLFDAASERLAGACGDARALTAAMTGATFLASMLVTNDVALIVLVPMTLIAFRRAGADPSLAVVLQTVAANVGSILLPMGNPQNLFLYSHYGMEFGPFIMTVLPLSAAGAVVLALLCLLVPRTPVRLPAAERPALPARGLVLNSAIFAVSVLAVFGAVDYRLALAAAIAALLAGGRGLARRIDSALLLTFVFLFVFVGNIAAAPPVAEALAALAGPRPFLAAAAASQIVSNVPAAVLLSRFTDDGLALLAGVSAGGCGTPVASMASLISYKLFARDGGARGRFLLVFTLVNILFLAVMTFARAASAARM